MFSRIFVLAAAAIFASAAVAQNSAPTPSQTPKPVPKQISGGVMNGKAKSLPKPKYPPAAHAVGAGGAVTVQVLIDEEGRVVSANAVSGHPLLRSAAVEAALLATFEPVKLSGQAVKVSGVIVYNFVPTMTPGIFAFEIAYAESKGEFREHVDPRSLAAQLPNDWVNERTILQGLTFEKKPASQVPTAEAKTPGTPNEVRDVARFTVVGSGTDVYRRGKLTESSLAKVRQLRADIAARIGINPRQQWAFSLGCELGKFVAEIEDINATRLTIEQIAQLVENSPLDAGSHFLTELRRFVESARSSDLGAEERQRLSDTATNLKGFRY